MADIDVMIVGAGVIGLAIARKLSAQGRDVIVVEREPAIGTGISSRNSEVIHAGLYYPQNSLKARLCVAGKSALYSYCRDHAVPHKQCGKIVVAGRDQDRATLANIRRSAEAAGVTDLIDLDAADLSREEPGVQGCAGLLSPSTGIIDSHQFMLSLQGQLEDKGGRISFLTEFLSAVRDVRSGNWIVQTTGRDSDRTDRLTANWLINAAALDAQAIAGAISGIPQHTIPTLYLANGHYYTYGGKTSFRHLIYPVPEPGGLGVHATLDLGGQVKFGPDVQWVDTVDFAFTEDRTTAFASAIRKYFPGLDAGKLAPGYTGIRPKLEGPGDAAKGAVADFAIQDASAHGLDRLICLYGIESPGLTSSLAIADHVWDMMREGDRL